MRFKCILKYLCVCFITSNTLEAMQPPQPISQGEIKFYESTNPFYEFTNFFPAPFNDPNVQGNVWKTSEHYFQGYKFNVPASRHILKEILDSNTPRDAFNIAQKNSASIRPNWHNPASNSMLNLKDEVMLKGLTLKFSTYPELAALLCATEGSPLVEDAGKNDPYWGNGGDGLGKNMLGKLLVKLRGDIINGIVKIDCSKHINLSGPSLQNLSALGIKGKYDQYFARFCGVPSAALPQSQQQQAVPPVQGQPYQPGPQTPQKITFANRGPIEPFYKNWDLNVAIKRALIHIFQGFDWDPTIEITVSGNMLIHTSSAQEANDLLYWLSEYYGVPNVNFDQSDNTTVFIPKHSIYEFLARIFDINIETAKSIRLK